MTKIFVIIGHKESGSGSLTYPEDFDIHDKYFTSKERALDVCDELNEKSQESYYNEDVNEDDPDSDEDFEGMLYEVREFELDGE